eukprot:Nitzschia sp. Nitz4//scaffold137_size62074//29292//30131//NITZ4_006417-RA/size62074-processed-gene-0.69-mRNA-1//1//CDS//3329535706//570//frame0
METADSLRARLELPPHQSIAEALDPESYVQAYWDENTRPDGRLFVQARKTQVVSSLLKHSIGSASVQLGDTKVLSSMTVQLGQPTPHEPTCGDVAVNVSSPDQRFTSSSLQAWLQRMLEDLLPAKLGLLIGKVSICIMVTVIVIQDDGSLKDAALLACMAAWKDARLPTMEDFHEIQGKLWWKDTQPTSLDSNKSQIDKEYRVSLTMGVMTDRGVTKFLVDPSRRESEFLHGMLTLVVHLPSRALQIEYSGETALSVADLDLAAKMATARADEFADLLK